MATALKGCVQLLLSADRRLRGQGAVTLFLAVQAALLAALAPYLLHEDSWLTLVAGRQVWEDGLPSHDVLGVLTAGRPWIDQQWLAQLLFYGASSVGGLPLVFTVHLVAFSAAVALALAVARRRGASSLGIVSIAVIALFVAPWSWQPRAQSLAYPLFVALLALLGSGRGPAPGRRVLLALPLLALWANVHGSALIGAALTVAFAGVALIRSRRAGVGRGSTGPALALLASPLCLLATPYGLRILDYYRSVMANDELSALAREWRAPAGPEAIQFGFLAVVALALLAVGRRRVGPVDLVVVVVTLGASLTAVRHFIWFALAMTMVLPPLIPTHAALRPPPRRARLAWAGVATLGAIAAFLLAQPSGWYEQRWPDGAGRALAAAADEDPGARVFVHGREADWLMWRHPSLEGRLAYDARLELLEPAEIRAVVRFDRRDGAGWQTAADGFALVWVNSRLRPELARALTREPGTRIVHRDGEVTLLRRPVARSVLARGPGAGTASSARLQNQPRRLK
jgi:hypothetical protein